MIKKNHALLVLKFIVIAAAFALIIRNSDTGRILGYLKSIPLFSLLVAYLMLNFTQVISALRMRFYFRREAFDLNKEFSVGLYFTGMFFNTILPGGIGGDGYKIYLLNKLGNFPKLKSLRLLISERASGLFILLLMSAIAAYFSDLERILPNAFILIAIGVVITIPAYFISIRMLLKERIGTALKAAIYSFFIQLFGIIIIISILNGLGLNMNERVTLSGYILLFLISSLLTILPISIGGVGIREVSFLYGSELLGLDPELGISIAITYFSINLICSLNGMFFWHRLDRLYKN